MLSKASALLTAILLSAPWTIGQSTFGDIVGVVKDPSQGAVPEAQVVLTRVEDKSQYNAGRFGTCGVGILQGPGQINVNAGLAKQFSLTERFRLRFEATFTNVLNHPNFAPPSLNISNQSTFGVLTSTLPQGLGGNRTGQLALRLDF